MIKTVSQLYPADFTNPQDAVASLVGTWDEDVTIQFLDYETYEFPASLSIVGIIVNLPYYFRFLGKYDLTGRTEMKSTAGRIITVPYGTAIRTEFSGFLWDVTGYSYIEAIFIKGVGVGGHSMIHNNIFIGDNRNAQKGVWFDRVGDNSVQNVEIYNNLFKKLGSAVTMKSGSTLYINTHSIWNNTFVKNTDNIHWFLSEAMRDDAVICIVNNIFDLLPSAIAFRVESSTYHIGEIDRLDYNIYYLRDGGGDIAWNGSVYLHNLNDFRAEYPQHEVHGIEADPVFKEYCVDYHPVCGSPCYDAGTIPCVGSILTQDIDDVAKIGNTLGAYRMECTNSYNLPANPQMDKKQNDTFWIELEDTRSSGDERPIRINLDYVRLK